ncbi:MAG TPA: hypothetical protein VMT62_06475 [Syntrophorhabdaceae bacterium]|nr:hypothetical protein [Syntrophorhabdaceae bacterium]
METAEKTARTPGSGAIQLGEILSQFSAAFFDETNCRTWILRQLHPHGAKCPSCGAELQGKSEKSFWENRRIHCSRCKNWFTALSKTAFSSVHMPFSKMMLVGLMFALGQPVRLIATMAESNRNTVRGWRRRFLCSGDSR